MTQDKDTDKYLKYFETYFNGQAKQDFHKIRKTAIEVFGRLGFPSTKQEEWRFTNIAGIARADFKLADKNDKNNISNEDIKPFLIENWDGILLVFIDGLHEAELSNSSSTEDQISIDTLNNIFTTNIELSQKISSVAGFSDESFTALNTAFTIDGAAIGISKNFISKKAIHILHISSGKNILSNHRNFINVEQSAQVTIIESFHSLSDDPAFVNSVTEIIVNENAVVKHYKLQNESENSYHVGNTSIMQKANSNYFSIALDFGGKLVRNNINTILDGHGIVSTLNGLYITNKNQHIDNHTFIDHAKPHCESHELYRGILNGKSKGVFSGKILVRRDAQKTDAKQSNSALLLSEDAQVDAKPQLEIYADDVKCTHGATIGQLDDQAINYLRARGIPKVKAVQMLTYAFAEEIILGIEDDNFRQKVEQLLLENLGKSI